MNGWFVVEGRLPEKLELNRATGEITGTPEEFGEFVFTVKLVNPCGETTKEMTINVCAEPTITGDDTFNFIMGQPGTAQLEFTGSPPEVMDEGMKGSFEFSELIELGQTVNISSPVQLIKGNIFKTKITGDITRVVDEYTTVIHNIEDSGVIDANTMFAVGEEIDSISPTLHFGIDEDYKITSVTSLNADIQGIDIVFDSEKTEKEPVYLLTFTVSDGSNPVSDANVVCLDSGNNPVSLTNNGNGTYSVEVPDGEYTYTISKTGFNTVNGSIIVDGDDENVSVDIVPVSIPESIIHIVDTSSGTFIVPTRGYGASAQNVPYNWIIDGSLDGENYTFIQNATGSSSYSSSGIDISPNIPDGLKSTNMYLRIRDFTETYNYGWARAFGFGSDSVTTDSGLLTNRAKVKSANISSCQRGFRLDGSTSLGNYFLYSIWEGCASLQTVVLPNTTNWVINSIGTNFLGGTWRGCTSLVNAVVPNMSNWEVTTIGNRFLLATWYGCTLLVTAVVPDTSGWNITSIGESFLESTWSQCAKLFVAVVPNTSSWNITSIGSNFLQSTWHSCTSLLNAVVPDTSGWNVTSIGGGFLSFTWCGCNKLETSVVPDTSGWIVSGSIGHNFVSRTWSWCSSLVTAVVPDTSNWNVTSIGDSFLYQAWYNCYSLEMSVVPDTSNWNVTSLGDSFLMETWYSNSFQTAVVPDTSGWNITSIKSDFLYRTWWNCPLWEAIVPNTNNWIVNNIDNYFLFNTWNSTILHDAVLPDASNWNVNSIGTNFLYMTFNKAFPSSGTGVLTIPDNISKPVYTGSIRGLQSNSADIDNSRIDQIKVPSALISAFQSSSSWSNITSSKFVAI